MLKTPGPHSSQFLREWLTLLYTHSAPRRGMPSPVHARATGGDELTEDGLLSSAGKVLSLGMGLGYGSAKLMLGVGDGNEGTSSVTNATNIDHL